jgi:hypothetical protein
VDNSLDKPVQKGHIPMSQKKSLAMENAVHLKEDQTQQDVMEASHETTQRATSAPLQPRTEYLPFANALRAAMMKAKLSASEVARRVWGTTKDTRGYEVAKGRDRIGHYLGGLSYPEPGNLAKLARAVGVPTEELTLERRPPPVVREPRGVRETINELTPEDIRIVFIGGDPSAVRLVMNQVTHWKIAQKIIALLKEDPTAGTTMENAMNVSDVLDDDPPDENYVAA